MLLELLRPLSFFVSILSLYPIVTSAFFMAGSRWEERLELALLRVAFAACICFTSGFLYARPSRLNRGTGRAASLNVARATLHLGDGRYGGPFLAVVVSGDVLRSHGQPRLLPLIGTCGAADAPFRSHGACAFPPISRWDCKMGGERGRIR